MFILYIACSASNCDIGILITLSEQNIASSHSCKGLGGSDVVGLWVVQILQ
jgi:hypothetical protein